MAFGIMENFKRETLVANLLSKYELQSLTNDQPTRINYFSPQYAYSSHWWKYIFQHICHKRWWDTAVVNKNSSHCL